MTTTAGPQTVDDEAATAVPVWLAALAGVLAAAAALGAAELVAGVVAGARSPVTSIGSVIIDVVPPALKDAAIATLGTADKPALLVGILLVLGAAAAGIGVAAVRRFWWGAAGVAALGLIGVFAGIADPSATGVAAVLPGLAAIAAGVAALWWLVANLGRHEADAATETDQAAGRRAFVRAAAMVGGAALFGGGLGRVLIARADAAAAPRAQTLPASDEALPPVPADASLPIDGLTPFVTPNADFYRIDTALQVPVVSVEDWVLRIAGLIDRPFELTYDQLLDYDLVEADITLACVSNEVGGDLVGNARWLGVRIADVLADVGIQPGADQLVGRAVDGFTTGAPLDTVLDGRESLIAVGMNGEPLPPVHGYPARLVVPGLYGYVSATKWLAEIEVTTFDAFDAYWVPRGWAERAPIKTQSRIDVPRSLATVPPGRTAVAGVAWAQTRGITRVEVKVDDRPWEPARLAAQVGRDTWRQWLYDWDATPGRHDIRVRATDGTGVTQTADREAPRPDGATGRHHIIVTVAES